MCVFTASLFANVLMGTTDLYFMRVLLENESRTIAPRYEKRYLTEVPVYCVSSTHAWI